MAWERASSSASQTKPAKTLPSSWTGADIGANTAGADISHDGGTFRVKGAGADIWGRADSFQFAYRALEGDGEIVARVSALSNTHPWAKAGVMIRSGLKADAPHAALTLTPNNGAWFIQRGAVGAETSVVASRSKNLPRWVKLSRQGETVRAYTSPDGSSWTSVGAKTLELGARAYVGLALTSHTADAVGEARFTNVNVGATQSNVRAPQPTPEPTPEPTPTADLYVATNGSDSFDGKSRTDPSEQSAKRLESSNPVKP